MGIMIDFLSQFISLDKLLILLKVFSKDLRLNFSDYSNDGGITSLKKNKVKKPLIESLKNFQNELSWLIPVVKNKKKIDFDIMIDAAVAEDVTVDSTHTFINNYNDISPYIRFAEILNSAYEGSKELYYLNALLKVMDILFSEKSNLSSKEVGRLSRLVCGENKHISNLGKLLGIQI